MTDKTTETYLENEGLKQDNERLRKDNERLREDLKKLRGDWSRPRKHRPTIISRFPRLIQ